MEASMTPSGKKRLKMVLSACLCFAAIGTITYSVLISSCFALHPYGKQ